jgi:hypothetical protein
MFWKASGRTIAIYQLISAAGFVFSIGYVTVYRPQSSSSFFIGTLLIYTGLLLVNLYAGIELLRDKRSGCWLSLFNMAVQVPAINLFGLTYKYVGVAELSPFLLIGSSNGTHLLGMSFYVSPGRFWIWFGAFPNQPQIAINLISLSFALFLYRSLRRERNNNPVGALR